MPSRATARRLPPAPGTSRRSNSSAALRPGRERPSRNDQGPPRRRPWPGAHIGAQSLIQRQHCVATGRWRTQFGPADGDLGRRFRPPRPALPTCRLLATLPLTPNAVDIEAVYEHIGQLEAGSPASKPCTPTPASAPAWPPGSARTSAPRSPASCSRSARAIGRSSPCAGPARATCCSLPRHRAVAARGLPHPHEPRTCCATSARCRPRRTLSVPAEY